jgi:serine protease Do
MSENLLKRSRGPGQPRRPIYWLPLLILLGLTLPAAAQDDVVDLEEAAFKRAAEVVADSIVQIRTIGGLEAKGGVLLAAGPTSGLVVDAEGWIVSSAYNFAELPSSILVYLPGGKTAAARLVATDHSRMIVLLKVDDNEPLPTPPFAEGESRVGQWSIALGKAYSQTQPNISAGVVSATGRMHGRAIQTDAKVSAVNYGGPLVDIRGRVLGILVPMSPQSDTVVAGAEWYDSGIGFAIPIGQVLARLDEMKEGRDQWPGKLGVALKEGPAYSTSAEVASVEPNSPADEAGLEKGDVITSVDSTEIDSQTDLFFALKPRYAGEAVNVAFRRGDETLSREITLVDKLRPYVAGFLGVLPERVAVTDVAENGEESQGIAVRYVYPDSPAARAEIRAGDRLTRIGDTEVASRDDALEAMQAIAAGQEVELEVAREGQTRMVTLQAVALPEQVPADVPAPRRPSAEAPDDAVETGPIAVKLPDLARETPAYVPRTFRSDVPHGLLVWLGDGREENSIEPWTELCDRYDVILFAPSPAGENWEGEDLEYLARVIPEIASRYGVDEERVVVGGSGAGAMAAFAAAGEMRERIRGVAAVEAGPPEQVRLASDPVQRLAILLAFDEEGENAADRSEAVEGLREAALPVTVVEADAVTDVLRGTIAKWIDTLDRF